MAVIKAQKIPKVLQKSTDVLATLCYFYPQYTYLEATRLPYKRVVQLINVARREQARNWYNQLRIAVAPHSKKASAVAKLLEEYRNIIEGK